MRFGVLTIPDAPWAALVERWKTLEELGLDSIWVPDHLVNPYVPGAPWLEGWTCLTMLARETTRARIGTLVSALSFRNPAALARAAVAVNALAGGRLELAVGAGGSPRDYDLARIERPRLRPAVEHLLDALAGETIPLTIGGQATGTLRLAARCAAGWNTYGGEIGTPAEEARRQAGERNERLDEYCREAGRDPGDVSRSMLLGRRYVDERPWRSEEAFVEVVEAWMAAGMDEMIFFYPPEFGGWDDAVAPGMFERVAREVMPQLRAG